jgi:chaperone modulatory protein CbpM
MATARGAQSARSDGGVTMQRRDFLLAAQLEAGALEAWVEAGWLLPRDRGEAGPFSDVDVARAQLIRDLAELGVNEEAIPIILDLVDQLHGLREALRNLLSTIKAESQGQDREIFPGAHAAASETRRHP